MQTRPLDEKPDFVGDKKQKKSNNPQRLRDLFLAALENWGAWFLKVRP